MGTLVTTSHFVSSDPLVTEDNLASDQYVLRNFKSPSVPEWVHALSEELLRNAIEDLTKHGAKFKATKKRKDWYRYDDAREWIATASTDPLGFDQVCENLNLAPDIMRKRLLAKFPAIQRTTAPKSGEEPCIHCQTQTRGRAWCGPQVVPMCAKHQRAFNIRDIVVVAIASSETPTLA